MSTAPGSSLYRSALGWFGVAVALAVWQLLSGYFGDRVVAPVAVSVAALGKDVLFSRAVITGYLLPSLGRFALGFGISATLGIILGAVIGYYRELGLWLRPLIDFARAIPPLLLIPVAILFLGLQGRLVVGMIVFGSIWPVLINTADGIGRVDLQYLDVARMCKLSARATLYRVSLPASMPFILSGLRLTLAISLIALVATEMVSGSSGIGYLILYAQQTFRVNETYAGVLLLGILGWLLDGGMLLLERRLLRWRPPSARSGGVA